MKNLNIPVVHRRIVYLLNEVITNHLVQMQVLQLYIS